MPNSAPRERSSERTGDRPDRGDRERRAPVPLAEGRARCRTALGARDGIAAKNLLGAILNEGGLAREAIGRIQVRDSFSLVELPEAGELDIYPRRSPKKTRAEGYEPFAPDTDLVPNVADFGQGYHIHVTGLIHDDTGFPAGSPKVTEDSIHRLHEKIARVGEEIIHTEEYFMDDAEYAVVAFGGTARTAYEAVANARKKGQKVGLLRLMTIWPFADQAIARLAAKVKGIMVAELNYGQVVNEVRRAVNGQCAVEFCGKYNMQTFEPAEIEAGIDALCGEGNK